MPIFRYKAYDKAGRHQDGEIEALSVKAALAKLHARGLLPFETIQAEKKSSWGIEISRDKNWKLPNEAWEEFAREMAIFLEAGLPLEQCLRLVAEHARSSKTRNLSTALHDKIIAGSDLSQSIRELSPDVPAIIPSIIGAAEKSGRLLSALQELSKFLETEVELKRKLTGALVYPAVLIITAFAVVAIIASTLVPALMPMFEQANTEPPFVLGLIAKLSFSIQNNWQVALISLILLIAGARILLRSDSGRMANDKFLLKLPFLGTILLNTNITLYARTLGTLLNNGLALIDAMELSAEVVTNASLKKNAVEATAMVREGSNLSKSLEEKGQFSPLAIRFISVGENASQLDIMLLHLARVLEAQTTRRLEYIVTLLGPVMTILIGIMVGGLILTVMQAVLGVNDLALQ